MKWSRQKLAWWRRSWMTALPRQTRHFISSSRDHGSELDHILVGNGVFGGEKLTLGGLRDTTQTPTRAA